MRRIGICVLAVLATGCAAIPGATVTYYPAKTRVYVKALRTVACSADNSLYVSDAITASVTHGADRAVPHELNLSNLRGTFADNDFKVELTEDGRLKTVNTVSTGQGEAIIKSFVALASTVAGVAKKAGPATGPCTTIKDVGGGKPITATYELYLNLGRQEIANPQELVPDPASKDYHDSFGASLGKLCVIGTIQPPPAAPSRGGTERAAAVLKLRQPGTMTLMVVRGTNSCRGEELWKSDVQIAQFGTDYELPIPKAAVFGTQKLNASFADSGALTLLQYSNVAGEGQAANALNGVVTALAAGTVAQQAASLKAESDLIVQEQRKVACLADPKNCK